MEKPIATGERATCCTRVLSDWQIEVLANRHQGFADQLIEWLGRGDRDEALYAAAVELADGGEGAAPGALPPARPQSSLPR